MSAELTKFTSRMPLQRWVEGRWSSVDRSRARLFARALGEDEPELLTGRRLCETFAVVAAWQTQDWVVNETFEPEAMTHGVHAEQRFEFVRPMEVDSQVRSRSMITGVRQREKGTLLSVVSEVLDVRGVVNRQHETIFALGASLEPERTPVVDEELSTPDSDDVGSPDFVGTWEATRAQVALYARASGEHFKLHTEDAYARSLGYSSVIMHGMCTLGIATRSIRESVRPHGDVRITALGVRFRAPVTPPSQLRTSVDIVHESQAGLSGRFETVDATKDLLILSQGYFEGTVE